MCERIIAGDKSFDSLISQNKFCVFVWCLKNGWSTEFEEAKKGESLIESVLSVVTMCVQICIGKFGIEFCKKKGWLTMPEVEAYGIFLEPTVWKSPLQLLCITIYVARIVTLTLTVLIEIGDSLNKPTEM